MDMHDCYKVETIGDAVLAVSGVPLRNGHEHSKQMARVALGFMAEIDSFTVPHIPTQKPLMRVGLHTGSLTSSMDEPPKCPQCRPGDGGRGRSSHPPLLSVRRHREYGITHGESRLTDDDSYYARLYGALTRAS